MSRYFIAVVVAFLVAGGSGVAYARGGGGMGGGMGGGGMGAAGGMSGSHMSAEGMANTNGPNADDRDKGLSRAEDRQNEKAASHEKAQKSHRKTRAGETTGEQR